MDITEWLVENYVTPQGNDIFENWIDSLPDSKTQLIIHKRLFRFKVGNFGDCKFIGGGIFEARIFYGPGFRIYFALPDRTTVLILMGGDKTSQNRDIEISKKNWQEYLRRTK